MQDRFKWLVGQKKMAAFVAAVALSGCVDRSTGIATSKRASTQFLEGRATVVVAAPDENGALRQAVGVANLGKSIAGENAQSFRVSSSLSLSTNTVRVGSSWKAPTFGSTATQAKKRGGDAFSVKSYGQRISTKRIDGHTVELYLIGKSGDRKSRAAGIIAVVDGKTRQYVEVETAQSRGKAKVQV